MQQEINASAQPSNPNLIFVLIQANWYAGELMKLWKKHKWVNIKASLYILF